MNEADKQATRQGWIQTLLTVGTLLVTGAIGFSNVSNAAAAAAEKAMDAKGDAKAALQKIEAIREEMSSMRERLGIDIKEIKVILEQRLPPAGGK